MDIDGSSLPNNPTIEDIDQNLLLQFSCMNTTDREELINQMQRLLGPSLSHNAASFFLDMSNWNLQAAICSYLDYTTPVKLPSMSLKAAESPTVAVSPGAHFTQSWSIANTGEVQWPGSCMLMPVGGEQFGATPVYVPPLLAGQTTTITLDLIAPQAPGTHRGFFYLMTDKNEKIGDTLWAEVTVISEVTMALAEQLAALPTPSSILNNEENIGPTPNPAQMPSPDDQMC